MEALPPAYMVAREEDMMRKMQAQQERESRQRAAAEQQEHAQRMQSGKGMANAVAVVGSTPDKVRSEKQQQQQHNTASITPPPSLKERTAAAFAKQGGLALQSRSATSSPLPSPGASNFGLANGFFTSFARSTASANVSPAMSRTSSSQNFLSPKHHPSRSVGAAGLTSMPRLAFKEGGIGNNNTNGDGDHSNAKK